MECEEAELYRLLFCKNATPNQLIQGEELLKGDKLISTNAEYIFMLHESGNLVLKKDGFELWSSDTGGYENITRCVMQHDGNLVLLRNNGDIVWESNTSNNSGGSLIVQNDGHVVITNVIWATGTS